jgi:hypothetical protein
MIDLDCYFFKNWYNRLLLSIAPMFTFLRRFTQASIAAALPISLLYTYSGWEPLSEIGVMAMKAQHQVLKDKGTIEDYVSRIESYQRRRPNDKLTQKLPTEVEEYWMDRLKEGTEQDKEAIVLAYSKMANIVPCCLTIANYTDKTIIGDILKLASKYNSEEQLGALKIVEGLRRNQALNQGSIPELTDKRKTINQVFTDYQTWWNQPGELPQKLERNPLAKYGNGWVEAGLTPETDKKPPATTGTRKK